MQLKLFAIYLPVGVMIVSLILFSQVSTAAASAELMDKEDDEDKAIKQELGTSETNPNDDNRGKQEEEEAAEEQESNDDTSESEDNVMIDDDGDGDDNINPSEMMMTMMYLSNYPLIIQYHFLKRPALV